MTPQDDSAGLEVRSLKVEGLAARMTQDSLNSVLGSVFLPGGCLGQDDADGCRPGLSKGQDVLEHSVLHARDDADAR